MKKNNSLVIMGHGNYLNKSFAERVSHLDEELDIRAGWDLVQEFILK